MIFYFSGQALFIMLCYMRNRMFSTKVSLLEALGYSFFSWISIFAVGFVYTIAILESDSKESLVCRLKEIYDNINSKWENK